MTAADALARVLDPEAFEPSEHPRDVGRELDRADRRRTAMEYAERAVAAGYERLEWRPSWAPPPAAVSERDHLANVIYDVNSPWYGDYSHAGESADAVLAAGYRLVSEEPELVVPGAVHFSLSELYDEDGNELGSLVLDRERGTVRFVQRQEPSS